MNQISKTNGFKSFLSMGARAQVSSLSLKCDFGGKKDTEIGQVLHVLSMVQQNNRSLIDNLFERQGWQYGTVRYASIFA